MAGKLYPPEVGRHTFACGELVYPELVEGVESAARPRWIIFEEKTLKSLIFQDRFDILSSHRASKPINKILEELQVK
jgi:hypothetical protein